MAETTFDDLKEKPTIKYYLKDLSFSHEGAHIAVTAGEGACSEMNDAFIFKSKEGKEVTFTQEEIDILREIGELPEDFTKSKQSGGEKEEMSEEITKKMEDLEKRLAVAEATPALMKYGFEEDLLKAIANELPGEPIMKAFDVLVERIEAAKAEVVEKDKEVEEEPTEIAKMLENESGDAEAPDEEIAKSYTGEVKDAFKLALKGGSN